jgi:hypothetical protein
MPSPFPGMDPYLEDPDFWHSLHTHLVIHICEDLQPQLLPSYVASAEERVVLGPLDYGILPDVNVREHAVETSIRTAPTSISVGGAAVAVPQEIAVPDLTIPHRFVTIRDTRSHQVVTIIEVLSPWNKIGDGQIQYRRKQAEILLSDAHLIEIDLLRRGQHTVALPEALAPASDYRICFHRARSDRFGYLAVSLREPLPSIPVPLRTPDADVVLHLQDVLTRSYDGGAFAYKVDYSKPPQPPLGPEDLEWTREALAAR